MRLLSCNSGCLVLGIVMIKFTETGLAGTLLRNKKLKFINKDVNVKVINNNTNFTNKYKKHQIKI